LALVLISTPGAVDANSYATAAEGTTYHEGHLYASAWTGASTATKEAALVMATRLLDALVEWSGLATSETQALAWPRVGMLTRNGYVIESSEIPADLKSATAEYARALIVDDRSADSDIESQGITSLTAGPVSLAFKDTVQAKPIPDSVFYLLPPSWGYIRSRTPSERPLVRG